MRSLVAKRLWEESSFNVVFNRNDYFSIEHVDRPDFVLRREPDGPLFGVEITDCYANESIARLHNSPNYLENLHNGKNFIHFQDHEILTVSKVDIIGPDGSPKQSAVPAVITESPRRDSVLNMMAEILDRKTAKSHWYHSNLESSSLVVDASSCLRIPVPFAPRQMLTPPLLRALQITTFSEVFVIAMTTETREVFLSLQRLRLMDLAYLYLAARENNPDLYDATKTPSHFFGLLVPVAEQLGIQLVTRRDRGSLVATYQRSALAFPAKNDLVIYDFTHADLPPAVSLNAAVPEQASLTSLVLDFYEANQLVGPLAEPACMSRLSPVRRPSSQQQSAPD